MGLVHANIRLANPRYDQPQELEVSALVDSGSQTLCLPADMVARLGLEANTTRVIETADGTYRRCRFVGPVRVRFEDRETYVGALELGNEVLLGALPMEDMDLVVHPKLQKVTANPAHPEGPRTIVK